MLVKNAEMMMMPNNWVKNCSDQTGCQVVLLLCLRQKILRPRLCPYAISSLQDSLASIEQQSEGVEKDLQVRELHHTLPCKSRVYK